MALLSKCSPCRSGDAPMLWVFFFFRYMANTETYLKNVALKHMPPNLQKVALLKSGEYRHTTGTLENSCK